MLFGHLLGTRAHFWTPQKIPGVYLLLPVSFGHHFERYFIGSRGHLGATLAPIWIPKAKFGWWLCTSSAMLCSRAVLSHDILENSYDFHRTACTCCWWQQQCRIKIDFTRQVLGGRRQQQCRIKIDIASNKIKSVWVVVNSSKFRLYRRPPFCLLVAQKSGPTIPAWEWPNWAKARTGADNACKVH